MARRALTVDSTEKHLTKQQREAREAAEAEWRRGLLSDYEPTSLDDAGMAAFATIAGAIPENRMSKVDGYTIEAAADAISKMENCRAQINSEGIVVDGRQNPAVVAYAKYAEIAKRFLVELGCTPSARAKIANDAAASASKQKTVADLFDDDD